MVKKIMNEAVSNFIGKIEILMDKPWVMKMLFQNLLN